MTLPELANALEAQEQRRAIRNEKIVEGAFKATNNDYIQQCDKNKQEKNGKIKRKKAKILYVHIVRKSHIFQYIVGLDLTFNVDFASKWDIWREFAKIKRKEDIKLRWLMNKRRSNCL